MLNTDMLHRPYWHVDAKWICGLLLAGLIHVVLVTYGLYQLTARAQSIEFTATIAAQQFSHDGLDAPINTPDVQQQLAASGTNSIKPFPGTNIVITRHEIETVQPRELRLKVFKELVTPLYDQGPKGVAASLSADPVAQEQIVKQLGILSAFTKAGHNTIGTVLLSVGIACLALLAGLIYFSNRFGRLVSPGIVLVSSAIPGFAIFLTLGAGSGNHGPQLGSLGPASFKLLSGAFLPGYEATLGIGLFLLVLAGVLKLIFHHRTRNP